MIRLLQNENGAAMVIALLIMVVVTIIGITASSTSTIEVQIATNDQNYKIAFYNADSGVFSTPKLISSAINQSEKVPVGQDTDASGFSYVGIGTSEDEKAQYLYEQIAGYKDYDNTKDVSLAPADIPTEVDIFFDKEASRDREESSTEFATGYEGVSFGAVGGHKMLYDLDSLGEGPRNSKSNIRARYRKNLGIVGGL